MAISIQEKEFACALSVWLLDQMTLALSGETDRENEFYDLGQSNFEFGCSALHAVGIFMQSEHFNVWRAVVTKDAIPHHLATNPPDRCALRKLMSGFAHQFGFVSDHDTLTGPFRPTYPELQEVCEKLADCGYLKRKDDETFDWDDSFGPWMVQAGNWFLDDFEPSPKIEVEKVLSFIPANDRDYLAGRIGGGHSMFARWFCGHWNGKAWISDTKDLDPDDDWDLSVAAGVYQRLQGGSHD